MQVNRDNDGWYWVCHRCGLASRVYASSAHVRSLAKNHAAICYAAAMPAAEPDYGSVRVIGTCRHCHNEIVPRNLQDGDSIATFRWEHADTGYALCGEN